eukprot:3839603-Ditylum_brightwellii.AAC.1
MSVNDDEFSYDSRVAALKSVTGKERKLGSSAISAAVMSPTRYNKKMGHVSIQWLVPSGKDTWKK